MKWCEATKYYCGQLKIDEPLHAKAKVNLDILAE